MVKQFTQTPKLSYKMIFLSDMSVFMPCDGCDGSPSKGSILPSRITSLIDTWREGLDVVLPLAVLSNTQDLPSSWIRSLQRPSASGQFKTNQIPHRTHNHAAAMASFATFCRISGFAAASCTGRFQQSRGFAAAARLSSNSKFFGHGPAPPRLPKEEQEIFEKLQQQSTGAFSTPRSRPTVNQSPDSDTTSPAQSQKSEVDISSSSGDELHPDVRTGAKPEFEGETNPRTGEVGGPKNEPLRWGAEGDWSFNGRVTDF